MRPHRRRSAAITLVLAGTISGCGDTQPQQDVYSSLTDCQRDWAPAQQQCQPVRDGRYNQTWYYGPSYFGERYPNGRPRPSPMAVEARRIDQPTQVASARLKRLDLPAGEREEEVLEVCAVVAKRVAGEIARGASL